MRLWIKCLAALVPFMVPQHAPASPVFATQAAVAIAIAASDKKPAPIVVSGPIKSTSGRSLVLWDSDIGDVRVFFSTKATITGTVVKGATVRVEGTLIEDFIRTTSIEVMATSVTVEGVP